MPSTTLMVKVVADTSQAAAKLQGASASTSRWAAGIRRAAIPAAAIGVAALKGADMVIDAASKQQQAMGAVDSVFGTSADTIKGWAATAAESVGLAKSEYMEMAAVVGSQLGNLGLPHDQVLGKTKDLMTMGADMAATYGGTTVQAVEALSSALRGETDPIERYGVSVKEADVKAQMLRDGTAKLTGTAGKAAKTNALLALVTKQGAKAAGAFARESDTLAGAQQRSAAKFEDAKAAIGQALLPAMTTLASIMAKVGDWAAKHPKLFSALIIAVIGVAAAVMVMNAALAITTALTAPITLTILAIVAALALFVAGIVLAWKKSATFRNVVLKSWAAIKAGAAKVWAVLQDIFRNQLLPLWRTLAKAAGEIFAAIGKAWRDLQPTFQEVWPVMRKIFAAIIAYYRVLFNVTSTVIKAIIVAWRWLTPGIGTVAAVIKVLIQGIVLAIQLMWRHFKTVIDAIVGIWKVLRSAISVAATAIKVIFKAISTAARAVWTAIVAVGKGIVGAWVAVRNGVATAVGYIRTRVFDPLRSAVGVLASAFITGKNIIISVFGTLASGLATVISRIRSGFVNAMSGTGLDRLIAAFRDARDSIVGIFDGIASRISGAINNITGQIQRIIDKIRSIPGLPNIPFLSSKSAPVPAAPMPALATTRTARSTTTDRRSPANPLAGATFQLILDGQVVERAVTKVTVAQNRTLARRILNGRPAQ